MDPMGWQQPHDPETNITPGRWREVNRLKMGLLGCVSLEVLNQRLGSVSYVDPNTLHV